MHDSYFSFLMELMRIDTVAPHEDAMLEVLCAFIRAHVPHDTLMLQEVGANRHNLIVTRGTPRMTLSSHLDTVGGAVEVVETTSRLYGRGACDAKGQIVAQLWAMARAAARGVRDYAGFWVVGEEVDSAGAAAASGHSAIGSDCLVNGEPTENAFVRSSRGVLECTVDADGAAQHSALDGGNSACHKLIQTLARMLAPADTFSVNVGTMSGGIAPNVTAAAASADLCVRFDGPSADVLAELRKRAGPCSLTLRGRPIEPFEFHVPDAFKDSAIAVPFCSDAPYYAARFKSIMMFGPGRIELAHTPSEHIEKAELVRASEMLSMLIT
jgi:acetylornithine deacetylase/succinyl-diaminopimelate desuccinylase-like protein